MRTKQIIIILLAMQIIGCEKKTNDINNHTNVQIVGNKDEGNLNCDTQESKTNNEEFASLEFQNINNKISNAISQMRNGGWFEKAGIYKAYPYSTDNGGGLMLLGKLDSKDGVLACYYGLHGTLRVFFDKEPVEIKCRYEIEGQEPVEFMIDISNEGFRKGFDPKEYDKLWKIIIEATKRNKSPGPADREGGAGRGGGYGDTILF